MPKSEKFVCNLTCLEVKLYSTEWWFSNGKFWKSKQKSKVFHPWSKWCSQIDQTSRFPRSFYQRLESKRRGCKPQIVPTLLCILELRDFNWFLWLQADAFKLFTSHSIPRNWIIGKRKLLKRSQICWHKTLFYIYLRVVLLYY